MKYEIRFTTQGDKDSKTDSVIVIADSEVDASMKAREQVIGRMKVFSIKEVKAEAKTQKDITDNEDSEVEEISQAYSIIEDTGDVRIVKSFTVAGKDEDVCEKLAEEELQTFIGNLTLQED